MRLDVESVTATLARAGCIAAAEEAAELIAAAGDPVELEDLVNRRTSGEPVAWLTGRTSFGGVDLHVAPGIYVPRWQTEQMARRAAEVLPSDGIGVDLCTGAGAIAAVMAAARPGARVLATELDPAAAGCARRNGIEVFEGHLDEPLPAELEGRVDVVATVVPYVPTEDLRLLPRDVREFEPRTALDGGREGTDFLKEVVSRSPRWLRTGGWLLLELGGGQAELLAALLDQRGFGRAEVMRDEEGDPRAICARLGFRRRRDRGRSRLQLRRGRAGRTRRRMSAPGSARRPRGQGTPGPRRSKRS